MRFIGFFLIIFLFSPQYFFTQTQDSEQIVNTTLSGKQQSPTIAKDGAGNFIIVWVSDNQDDGLPGIYARRYNQSGFPLGSEFQVNTVWAPHEHPAAAMSPNGSFVICWTNHWIEGGTGGGVSARVFTAAGVPIDQEFQVNQYEQDFQGDAAVAMDGLGYFAVTWQSWREDGTFDIYARLFDAQGAARTAEFRVNTYTNENQTLPRIAMDNNGNFVIVWTSYGQDGDETGVYARVLDRSGQFQSAEFRVNFATMGRQEHPNICMDALGNFSVCWQSVHWNENAYDVFARTFDRTGQLKGPEFRVNSRTENWQAIPAIDCDHQGRFLVIWQGRDLAGESFDIYGRRFDQYGQPLEAEFQINTYTQNRQTYPQIKVLFPQTFSAVWQSLHEPETSWDIYSRVFQGSANLTKDNRVRHLRRHD
ncbi:MAG: hypothetical protein GQ544_10230 [Candidatus Aminicenantes bacterium]|nr:hypothetical protein [Candidatus Aminicenantes bacterium]